jgi:tRNA A37 threonylcarbamoyladenosine modification protein TsaB
MVVPVSNLMAIAYLAKSHLSLEVSLLAPWVDVRRGEVAGAVYRQDLTRRLDPLVATAEVFAGRVAELGSALFCGPEASRLSMTPHLQTARVLAGAIAQVAVSGKGLDPAEAGAEYVRHADVRKSE